SRSLRTNQNLVTSNKKNSISPDGPHTQCRGFFSANRDSPHQFATETPRLLPLSRARTPQDKIRPPATIRLPPAGPRPCDTQNFVAHRPGGTCECLQAPARPPPHPSPPPRTRPPPHPHPSP